MFQLASQLLSTVASLPTLHHKLLGKNKSAEIRLPWSINRNPVLRFADSSTRARKELSLIRFIDDQERLSFLTELAKKVNKPASQDAYVYALVAASDVKLRLQDFSGAREDLNIAESILDTFDSVETEVHASFYRTNASYYQVISCLICTQLSPFLCCLSLTLFALGQS